MAPLNYLHRHSSPVDWCEPNYAVSSSIAEFYNTTSSVPFIVFPALLFCLSRSYERHFGKYSSLNPFWLLLPVVGVGSAYFHATLSLAGQLLDELSILWILVCSVFQNIPHICKLKGWTTDPQSSLVKALRTLLLSGTALTTLLSIRWPQINAPALMLAGIGYAVLIYSVMHLMEIPPPVEHAAWRAFGLLSFGTAIWIIERTACDYVGRVGSFLHASWHVIGLYVVINGLAADACYHASVRAKAESGRTAVVPTLKYWPAEWRGVGLPYVECSLADEAPESGKIHHA